MGVTNTNAYDGPFYPNGVTTSFPFTFRTMSTSEVIIVDRQGAQITGFSFSILPAVGADGGSIVFDSAPTAVALPEFLIASAPNFGVGIDLGSVTAFNPRTLNPSFERLAAQNIFLKDRVERSPQTPLGGGAENRFPVVQPDGSWGFSAGTGNDPALRSDLADPDLGLALTAYDQYAPAAAGSGAANLQQMIWAQRAPALNTNSDNIAVDRAISKAVGQAGGGVVNIPPNAVFELTQREVPRTVVINAGDAVLQPKSATPSLFKLLGGLSGVIGGQWVNSGNLAAAGIVINKTEDTVRTLVSPTYMAGFATAILNENGNAIDIIGGLFINNGVAIRSINDFRNSVISRVFTQGGNGVSLENGTTHQPEGVVIDRNKLFPATGGTYAIQIKGGLDIKIRDNVLDQVITGNGIVVDGVMSGVKDVIIEGNWIGRQYLQAGALRGIYAVGAIKDLHIHRNTIVGFQQAGIYANGTAPGVFTGLKAGGNIWLIDDRCYVGYDLNYVEAAIAHERFTATGTSISEGTGVSGRVDFCDFTNSPLPSSVMSGLRYGRQHAGMVLRKKLDLTIGAAALTVSGGHGLSYTPDTRDFNVHLINKPPTSPGQIYVTAADAVNVTVACDTAPGASLGVRLEANIER
ncbi:hypothetical protein K3M67_04750 [Sphingobium sp. V4]|uniref:hypothetical protein n=1 Tax=Sphingobium sp. V4 TaxID=3038927 RepID=UPI002557E8C2|nr:hypothetical protein [Sphingobium sp. V4]WIW89288.1 hypothetical protein K3M67_04750 [Sphingobium sp. V4]